MKPIALQLYSLRDQLAGNFESVVRHVAEIGYAGVETGSVETGGVFGEPPESAASLFQELGLQVPAAHVSIPDGSRLNDAVALARTLGTRRVAFPYSPPERFASVASIREVCTELNRINQGLRARGLELFYHNHWQECEVVDGKPGYQHMLEFLDPTIGLEVDVYWAKTAGLDPVAMVQELGTRAPLLHLKDGPATHDGNMTALGEGVVDIPAIMDASRLTADWWIVEIDRCDTDMMEAVEKSLAYLMHLEQ